MSSPTQRTLKKLRQEGWEPGVVEKWNSFAGKFGKRIDLFGIIDIIAVKPGVGILGVQCTSASNVGSHITKALLEPRLKTWLLSGGKFEIWGWSKKGPRGKVKHWKETRRAFVMFDDYQVAEVVIDEVP